MKNTLLFIVFLSTTIFSSAQNFELRLLENLSKNRTPGTTHFMQGVSNTTSYITIGIPVSVFVIGALDHDEKIKQKSFVMGEGILASIILTEGLKYIINRPRPSTKDSLIIPATDIGSPSFPSGHTSNAFAAATAISIAFPKWYVIAPSFLWAGTVGFSRMYLGAHYPSDVLAGAIVGSASSWLSYKINKWMSQKHHSKSEIRN